MTQIKFVKISGTSSITLGSGFPLILNAWNERHWLRPELIELRELMQVKLILSIETKENGSFVSQDGPKDDPKDGLKQLSDRQTHILNAILENKTLTREQLAQRIGVSDSTIKRELSILQKKGILSREGGRKEGKWRILVTV